MLATASYAGNLVFEAEEEEEIVIAEEPMGSSNASWIIPLLAIGVIGLAIASSQDDDDDEDDNGSNGSTNGSALNGSLNGSAPNGSTNGSSIPPPPV